MNAAQIALRGVDLLDRIALITECRCVGSTSLGGRSQGRIAVVGLLYRPCSAAQRVGMSLAQVLRRAYLPQQGPRCVADDHCHARICDEKLLEVDASPGGCLAWRCQG